MRREPVLDQQQNVKTPLELLQLSRTLESLAPRTRTPRAAYSTLPIFFTAAISRALSVATNWAKAGAS